MTELCSPMAKTYAFTADNDTELKLAKGTKQFVINHRLTFENYKESVLKNKAILRSQLRFKSDGHNVYTEEINKFQYATMMIKDYKHLTALLHINMEHQHLRCVNQKFLLKIKGVPIAMHYKYVNYLQYLIDNIDTKNKSQYFGRNIYLKNSKSI